MLGRSSSAALLELALPPLTLDSESSRVRILSKIKCDTQAVGGIVTVGSLFHQLGGEPTEAAPPLLPARAPREHVQQ